MAGASPLHLERLPGEPGAGFDSALRLCLASDVGLVDDAVELLARHCFSSVEPNRQVLFRLRVALAEALANAIQFGNGGDPGKIVCVHVQLFVDRIRVSVTDEGSGFDPGKVPDPRDPDQLTNPRGRGLFIIRHLAEDVAFNERGNTIWMTLPRS